MPSALPLRRAAFSVCVRLKPTNLSPSWRQTANSRSITANEKPLPKADTPGPGPNQEQLPHVTEEAAAMAKITGETVPDVQEQGTPVQEVLKRDETAKENAPQVLKKDIEKPSPSGTRSFSTSARRPAELVASRPADLMSDESPDILSVLDQSTDMKKEGHIFGIPQLPLARNIHLRRREDSLIEQTTKLIMQSGKLSKAQNTMSMILERLRTTKPPTYSATRTLLPGSPPASHLPLNPVLYMTLAIDSVAPLMRLKSIKGAAGGGMALQIPVSLKQRQRRRTAIMWILEAAEKKRSMGSGRAMFAHKVADEIIAVIEGRSGVWEKRANIHRMSTAARANLVTSMRRRR